MELDGGSCEGFSNAAAAASVLPAAATHISLAGSSSTAAAAATAAGGEGDWLLVEPGWADDADQLAGPRAGVQAGAGVFSGRQGVRFESAMDVDGDEAVEGAGGRVRAGGRGGAMQLSFGGH
jgi:hypothetical protein